MKKWIWRYIGLMVVGFAVGIWLGSRGEVMEWVSSRVKADRVTQEMMMKGNDEQREKAELARVVNEVTEEEVVVTVVAVGDVMLSREVQNQMVKRGDFTWPFLETAEVLREANVTLGNLETPMLDVCPVMTNRMVFCAEEESREGLTAAGFDGLSLANNHILNQGWSGLEETEKLLAEVGIVGVKEGEVKAVEVKGIKIGIMAADDVSRRVNEVSLGQEVASAAAEVDVMVVMMHWGVEYVDQPTDRQRELGYLLVDAGADLVLGAHPHWVQPAERYKEGVIFWSLGNFVFDQMWSEETRLGEIALVALTTINNELETIEYEMVPVRIYEYGQPRVVE